MKLTKGKLIGRGAFSRVYNAVENKNYVVIESTCGIKECGKLGWLPTHRMIPKYFENENDYSQIIMKRYDKVRKVKGVLNDKDYHIYSELRKAFERLCAPKNPHNSKDVLHELFNGLDIHHSYKTMLHEYLDGASNYGTDIGFEISPRNIAIDKGKLILLDCFFIKSQLNEIRSSKSGA